MAEHLVTEGLTPLIEILAGEYFMGAADFYPDEGPVRKCKLESFALEKHPVTNAQFAAFVEDTGYVTTAEQFPDPELYPGVDPEVLIPGGLVFTPTPGPVPLDRWDLWWRWVPGASWRYPQGPGSDVLTKLQHPVVMVSYMDALAYATWAGRRLPTEAEFEYAAGTGKSKQVYAWGDELQPRGRLMANTWQGRFPYKNEGANGWVGTSPVLSFPANDWGFFDMIGNVWEWTGTYYACDQDRHEADNLAQGFLGEVSVSTPTCCSPTNAHAFGATSTGAAEERLAQKSSAPNESLPRRVLKGGSHLCAPEYCFRYRPAARSPQSIDSATTHIGFRCAQSLPA